MQNAAAHAQQWFKDKGASIEKLGSCTNCGAPLFKTKIIVNGEVIESAPPCKPCEDYLNGIRAKENKKRDEKLFRQKVFNQNSLMNDLLKEATFEKYKQEDDTQKEAFKLCLTWYNALLKPEYDMPFTNVLLYGKVGRGKSHLAAATAKALNEAGKDVLFVTTGRLFRKLKATFHKDSEHTEESLMSMLEKVDILFLDDIGAQNATDWKSETVLNLLDARQGKHTFYTTNLDPTAEEKELNPAEILGERSWERMLHMTAGLEVRGKNRRAAFKDWRSYT